MKKIILALISFIFIFCGCSQAVSEINPIVTDYLSILNVSESKIEKIDYKKISDYENKNAFRDLTYISTIIDEVLEVDYSINSVDKTIADGDVVSFELLIKDKSGKVVHKENNAKILVGSECLKSIEKELMGKSKKYTNTFSVDNSLKEFFANDSINNVTITVLDIYQYIEGEEIQTFFSENGFSSFKDYYVHFFERKTSEHDFEKNNEAKDNFYNFATEICEYHISDKDLENYSQQILKEHIETAESFNMSIEEYYENVLSLDESSFFEMCAESADAEIKKALLIGALSEYYEIGLDDKTLEEFCTKNNIDSTDDVLLLYAKYYCLENEVVENFVNTY